MAQQISSYKSFDLLELFSGNETFKTRDDDDPRNPLRNIKSFEVVTISGSPILPEGCTFLPFQGPYYILEASQFDLVLRATSTLVITNDDWRGANLQTLLSWLYLQQQVPMSYVEQKHGAPPIIRGTQERPLENWGFTTEPVLPTGNDDVSNDDGELVNAKRLVAIRQANKDACTLISNPQNNYILKEGDVDIYYQGKITIHSTHTMVGAGLDHARKCNGRCTKAGKSINIDSRAYDIDYEMWSRICKALGMWDTSLVTITTTVVGEVTIVGPVEAINILSQILAGTHVNDRPESITSARPPPLGIDKTSINRLTSIYLQGGHEEIGHNNALLKRRLKRHKMSVKKTSQSPQLIRHIRDTIEVLENYSGDALNGLLTQHSIDDADGIIERDERDEKVVALCFNELARQSILPRVIEDDPTPQPRSRTRRSSSGGTTQSSSTRSSSRGGSRWASSRNDTQSGRSRGQEQAAQTKRRIDSHFEIQPECGLFLSGYQMSTDPATARLEMLVDYLLRQMPLPVIVSLVYHQLSAELLVESLNKLQQTLQEQVLDAEDDQVEYTRLDLDDFAVGGKLFPQFLYLITFIHGNLSGVNNRCWYYLEKLVEYILEEYEQVYVPTGEVLTILLQNAITNNTPKNQERKQLHTWLDQQIFDDKPSHWSVTARKPTEPDGKGDYLYEVMKMIGVEFDPALVKPAQKSSRKSAMNKHIMQMKKARTEPNNMSEEDAAAIDAANLAKAEADFAALG